MARRSDGLSALAPGEARSAVLAGLGGGLIASALARGGALTRPGAEGALWRVIAQPNLEPERVRAWSVAAGWAIRDETLVLDGGRHYPIIVLEAAKGPVSPLDERDLLFGPLLRRRRDANFLAWLQSQQARLRLALGEAELQGSTHGTEALRARLRLLEEELR